jgi:HEPN domain-containing protein
MNGPVDHALGLLRKARNDLIAARATLATGEALDTVCFHAQQAAEKSLKALLALDDVEYPWRHDLGELLELVKPRWREVASIEERVIALAPFAVAVRYEDAADPAPDEARLALDAAHRVYTLAAGIVGRRSDQQ